LKNILLTKAMKHEIKLFRVKNADGRFFKVYKNGNLENVFAFKENQPEGSLWNEVVNLKLAKEYAILLQDGEIRQEIDFTKPLAFTEEQLTQHGSAQ